LNSSFHSYFDIDPSFQKYQKHHCILLLSILKQQQEQSEEKYVFKRMTHTFPQNFFPN